MPEARPGTRPDRAPALEGTSTLR